MFTCKDTTKIDQITTRYLSLPPKFQDMKIVIAGAGDLGFHLAKLLCHEQQDITLIDLNADVLEYAQTHLDVMTIHGDSASITILEQAGVGKANLFLAMTTSEKTNLVSAILAKKMGARQTIARVTNPEYITDRERETFKELGIDRLIAPTLLAAHEIERLVKQTTVTDLFDFEQGKISLAGLKLDDNSPLVNLALEEIERIHQGQYFKPIAILRGDKTILPKGSTILRRQDHIYFLTKKENIEAILSIAGKDPRKVHNVMIIGGTPVGLHTAKILEKNYHVTIVEKDKNACKHLVANLEKALVIKGDPSNIELLKEEGLSKMDAFIAVTPNSETNIISSVIAEESGVYKTIAMVDNIDYIHISLNIGVDTLINKKLIAANNIFRFVRKGRIEAIASLHGIDAEVIEYILDKESRLTRKPIKSLHLPAKAIIAGVLRGDETIFPSGEFQMNKGDRVIVFCQSEHIEKVERIFR
jgi:trk system potassium uptake protein TrkA